MKPNILLIVTDQMRCDSMGIAGNPVIETPHLDNMAARGAYFENAYSAAPTCIPARAALFTGMSQSSHGRVGYQDRVPWEYENYLAGVLADGGYHTQCVGKMHVHPPRSLCGFHNISLHDGYLHAYRDMETAAGENQYLNDDYLYWLKGKIGIQADAIDTGLECNSWVARPWIYDEHLHPTNWVVTEPIDFLRKKDPTKPFFLTMSFVRPHSPLDPPQYYFDMYQGKANAPLMGDWAETEDVNNEGLIYNTLRGKVDEKQLQRARAAYYGCITHIDHQIGRFMRAMFDYNALQNTIILFTSDHGDLLGDHNLFRKSLPYKGSAGVPFIVYDPGNHLKIKPGTRVSEVVELRDIMPTLLDIAGVDIPETVDGKSVLPLIKGDDKEWREYIHGGHTQGMDTNQFIVTKKDKYIWFAKTGREQYFDLENDPDELCNLIGSDNCQERIAYLREMLVKELAGREDGYSDGVNLITKPTEMSILPNILKRVANNEK